MYDHIMRLPNAAYMVADSAFATSIKLEVKVIKSPVSTFYVYLLSEGDVSSEKYSQLTSLRQFYEWRNKDMTSVYRWLKTRLTTKGVKHGLIMWCAVLLHNWRLSTMKKTKIYFEKLLIITRRINHLSTLLTMMTKAPFQIRSLMKMTWTSTQTTKQKKSCK